MLDNNRNMQLQRELIIVEGLDKIFKSKYGLPKTIDTGQQIWIGYELQDINHANLEDVFTAIKSYIKFANLSPLLKEPTIDMNQRIIGMSVSKKSHEAYLNKVLSQSDTGIWGKIKKALAVLRK